MEVEQVHTISAGSAVKFIKGLMCQFGVPNRMITDNDSQFTSGLFRSYCANLGMQICYASVAHPRSNGQAERANVEVLKGLKTRSFKKKLEACGTGWLDELQSVSWSISTTATKPTGGPHSSSSTRLRRSFPQSLSMVPRGSCRSTRCVTTTRGGLIFCSSRRPSVRPPSAPRGTSKPCSATTVATSALAPLRLGTSSYGGPLQGGPSQTLTHVGGPLQGRPCLQAWRSTPGDGRWGARAQCLEHPASELRALDDSLLSITRAGTGHGAGIWTAPTALAPGRGPIPERVTSPRPWWLVSSRNAHGRAVKGVPSARMEPHGYADCFLA
ncbi:putative polyprotein [Hordeum vulgare]|nr:putative polyprotein [Hordeum vulgare]